jgi:hypothetical protein
VTHQTFVTLRSVGIKSNRRIERAETKHKIKLAKPTSASLKALGYTTSQREAILASYNEL